MIKNNLSSRTAIIAGTTGLVGSNLLNLLLQDSTYNKVIAITRKELNIKNEKLVQLVTDLDNLPNNKDKLIADDVFCCLGTTIKKAGSEEAFRKVDYQYPLDLAKLTLQNGSKQYLIITSMGANAASRIFYNRVKGEVENEIMKLEFKSINIFRPSIILGERNESRPGENIGKILFGIFNPVLIKGLRKFRAIEASDIAKAMLITAKEFHTGTDVFESDRIQSVADSFN